MRKMILIAVATLFFASTAVAQSQIEAKKIFLNAELSGLNATFTPSPFSIGANVGGGYFIIDNLAVRALAGINFTAGENGLPSNTDFHFGVGGRYYLKGFFLDALFQGANIGRNEKFEKKLEVGVRGALGYAIFLNDHVAFEPAVTFDKFFIDGSKAQVGLNAAFSIYF
jgi:hypothetical protein